MDDGVGALHLGGHGRHAVQVADDERHVLAGEELRLGLIADERDDLVATISQPLDDGATDEPGAAGYDDAHVLIARRSAATKWRSTSRQPPASA